MPILSIGSPPDSAIGKLIEETGCGICAGGDPVRIEAALRSLLAGTVETWFRPDRDAVLRHHRAAQAERLWAEPGLRFSASSRSSRRMATPIATFEQQVAQQSEQAMKLEQLRR